MLPPLNPQSMELTRDSVALSLDIFVNPIDSECGAGRTLLYAYGGPPLHWIGTITRKGVPCPLYY